MFNCDGASANDATQVFSSTPTTQASSEIIDHLWTDKDPSVPETNGILAQ
jgi:hypothetical protein